MVGEEKDASLPSQSCFPCCSHGGGALKLEVLYLCFSPQDKSHHHLRAYSMLVLRRGLVSLPVDALLN